MKTKKCHTIFKSVRVSNGNIRNMIYKGVINTEVHSCLGSLVCCIFDQSIKNIFCFLNV